MQKIIDSLIKNRSQDANGLNFFSQYNLEPGDCHIEISEIGKMQFPVSKENIEKLLKISSQAKFGHGEKTLLDKKVRNTQEIPTDQLNVKFNEEKFTKMLDSMKQDMGLPENSSLKAFLHSMLIYTPGQFFKKHQDTEKLEGMVATLTVVLPSTHIGGDLILEHNNHKHCFSSENVDEQKIQCLSFYADCQHKVKKVTQGYRIAMTFNLVLENQDTKLDNINTDLEKALTHYFSKPKNNSRPQMLVYLLDHEYTEHSLRFNMLKGVDNKNVSDFLFSAKKLGLGANLALIELHQTWSAFEEYDTNLNKNTDNFELNELINKEQHLYCWFDRNDNKLPYKEYFISEDNICYSTQLSDLEPSDSEYEGYMGNWGNTMDYWYKRAVIVLWPEKDQTQMSFILDYKNQIEKLAALTYKEGNEKQVKEITDKAGQYLYHCSSESQEESLKYQKLLEIAYYLNDKSMARPLIDHFKLTGIKKDHIPIIAKLQERYDPDYCLKLMKKWQHNLKESCSSYYLIENIDQIIEQLSKKGCNNRLADFLLQHQCDNLIKYYLNTDKEKPKYLRKSQVQRLSYVANIFKSLHFFYVDKIAQDLITYLIGNPVLYPHTELATIICSLNTFSSNKISKPVYDILCNHLIKSIDKELKQGCRKSTDWSIKKKLFCRCKYCKEANDFLSSNDEQKTWPIIKGIRKHIMDQFDEMDLPIKLEVLKKGSPHKLVMTKIQSLHKDARNNFKKLQAHYHELTESMLAKDNCL